MFAQSIDEQMTFEINSNNNFGFETRNFVPCYCFRGGTEGIRPREGIGGGGVGRDGAEGGGLLGTGGGGHGGNECGNLVLS